MEQTIFKNAPLVEMIAEIRWSLTPVQSVPGGGVDPFYKTLKEGLAKKLAEKNYRLLEEVIPQDIPREFLGGQVTTRYRQESNTWPLYQLGPGVFTVNITEGYTGWLLFKETLRQGIEALISSHPAVLMLEIQSLKLVAIGAFSHRHGFTNYYEFSKEYLGLSLVLPEAYIEKYTTLDRAALASETVIPLSAGRVQGVARIDIREGQHNENKALLMNTSVESTNGVASDLQSIVCWFDEAHIVHSDMFESILSDKLRTLLESEVEQ